MTVKGNIAGVKNNLTDQEKKIADYLLKKPSSVLSMNVAQLAKVTQTSAATISRFVRRLNFTGYNELKLQLSADLNDLNTRHESYEDITPGEDVVLIKDKLLNNAIRSLNETVDQVGNDLINGAIRLIHDASQIMIFGVGASFLVAQNVAQKWGRLGFSCVVTDDLNQLLPLIATIKPNKNNLLWLISNSGESSEVVLAGRLAKEAGITVMTASKMGNNSLNRLGDLTLQTSQPMEANYRIAATQSLHAQFMLIDIVYYAFVSRYYDETCQMLKKSSEIVRKYKNSLRNGL